jgi:hypothetical protein
MEGAPDALAGAPPGMDWSYIRALRIRASSRPGGSRCGEFLFKTVRTLVVTRFEPRGRFRRTSPPAGVACASRKRLAPAPPSFLEGEEVPKGRR